jgi:hypothetical protein
MCEFCISHGEGKKWYKNITNYSRELFLQVSSDEALKEYLARFGQSMQENIPTAEKWKKRLPVIYNFIAYPWLSRRFKKNHFGQMVPIEDIEKVLNEVGTVWRLPCICRKVAGGEEKRYCYAIGMDATGILKDLPDFRNFDQTTPEVAISEIRDLDTNGMTHSVWTFQTPFISLALSVTATMTVWLTELNIDHDWPRLCGRRSTFPQSIKNIAKDANHAASNACSRRSITYGNNIGAL